MKSEQGRIKRAESARLNTIRPDLMRTGNCFPCCKFSLLAL